MNTNRDTILQKLRSAVPGRVDSQALLGDSVYFRDYPDTGSACVTQLAAQLLALKAELVRADSIRAAAQRLKSLLQPLLPSNPGPAPLFARHAHALLDEVCQAEEWLEQHVVTLSGTMDNLDFEKIEVGITAADFLVARTGSMVLRAGAAGGRRLSVLPPFHIAIARTAQIVNSLEEAFAGLAQVAGGLRTSSLTVITGPSRTSDIEKTLVLGAHGPKRLAVILID